MTKKDEIMTIVNVFGRKLFFERFQQLIINYLFFMDDWMIKTTKVKIEKLKKKSKFIQYKVICPLD